jgi:hypothetical protein
LITPIPSVITIMGVHNIPHPTYSHNRYEKPIQPVLWDPIETLQIINPDKKGLTCVGYAPSCRRRCRNSINAENHADAFVLLKQLSFLDPASSNIRLQLRELAHLTLYLRNHQDQVHAVVNDWENKSRASRRPPHIKQRDDLANSARISTNMSRGKIL